MTNSIDQVSDFLRAVDHASQASDRWWIAALFFLLILFVSLACRWLVGKYEALTAQARADQQEYAKSLISISGDANKTNKDLAVVLDRCSCALTENTTALAFCRENHNHHAKQ